NLTPAENAQIFPPMVNLWLKARELPHDWTLPFATTCYEHTPQFLALRERAALAHWRNQEFAKSLQGYQYLEERAAPLTQKIPFNQRVLQLAALQYGRDQAIIPYQKSIIAAIRRFQTTPYQHRLEASLYQLTKKELEARCQQALPPSGLSL